MLFEGEVFGLFTILKILADVEGKGGVFFDLLDNCDVLHYSLLGLCLDEGAIIVGAQVCDIAWVNDRNRLSYGLLLWGSVLLSFWLELEVGLYLFLGLEKFGAEKIDNPFVGWFVVLKLKVYSLFQEREIEIRTVHQEFREHNFRDSYLLIFVLDITML